MKTFVYIDGFNLYYRGLKGTPHRWLDVRAFAKQFLKPECDIITIRYFTARVSGRRDADVPQRQQQYISALKTLHEVTIHYGRFITKTKKRPVVQPDGTAGRFYEFFDSEEKGSDVNLATYLIHDAHRGLFDTALVLSQDTDLLEPIRIVAQDIKIPVGVVQMDRRRSNPRFRDVSSFMKNARPAHYSRSQFPDEVRDKNGDFAARKPTRWNTI